MNVSMMIGRKKDQTRAVVADYGTEGAHACIVYGAEGEENQARVKGEGIV